MARNLFDLGSYFGGRGGGGSNLYDTQGGLAGDPWTDTLNAGGGGFNFGEGKDQVDRIFGGGVGGGQRPGPTVPPPTGTRPRVPKPFSGRVSPYPHVPPPGGGGGGGLPNPGPGGGGGPRPPTGPAPGPFPQPQGLPGPLPRPRGFPGPGPQPAPLPLPGSGRPKPLPGPPQPPGPTGPGMPMPPQDNRMLPPNFDAMLRGLLTMMAGLTAHGGDQNPMMQMLSQYGNPVDFQQVLGQAMQQMPETWLPQLRAHFFNTPFYGAF